MDWSDIDLVGYQAPTTYFTLLIWISIKSLGLRSIGIINEEICKSWVKLAEAFPQSACSLFRVTYIMNFSCLILILILLLNTLHFEWCKFITQVQTDTLAIFIVPKI